MAREIDTEGFCPACRTKFTKILIEDKAVLVGGVPLLMSTCLRCSTVTFINKHELAKRMSRSGGAVSA
jgi:hypothetical protein